MKILQLALVALSLTTYCRSVSGFVAPKFRVSTQPHILSKTSPTHIQMVMDKMDPLDLNSDERISTELEAKKSKDPKPVLVNWIQNAWGGNHRQASLAAAAALTVALAMWPLSAEAAMSGGRMGGSYPSSSSPPAAISRPAPSSSASYSRGYSRGYTSGYYSRPSVTIAPSVGYGHGFSPFGYSPFRTGYYGGGPGVISYSRGPNFFDLVVVGGVMFALLNMFKNSATASTEAVWDSVSSPSSALGPGISVLKLSVALEVPNRDDPQSILSVLNRMSQTAKTDSRVGLQNLTSQVALELLRKRSSIVSASSSYKHYRDATKAGRDYEAKAIRERSKFEQETVSKYGGVDYSSGKSALAPSKDSGKATMAVVTLVMAIQGDTTKLPNKMNSMTDVEEALRQIASDSKVDDCLQRVEILWTPEDRSESLSLREVIADYPELRSV